MSYPAPPPPGQGDSAGQGGPGPYQPNPYASAGGPHGQPPKKDNTLWWILGIIAAVVLVCCLGVCGFFGWGAYVAQDEIGSATSSDGSQAASAEEVSEGSEATDNGATVLSSWFMTSNDELSGVSLRNDGSSRDMLSVKFYFMEDGELVEDASCTTKFLDPGETDYSPTCLDPIQDISGYDEIRFAEGS